MLQSHSGVDGFTPAVVGRGPPVWLPCEHEHKHAQRVNADAFFFLFFFFPPLAASRSPSRHHAIHHRISAIGEVNMWPVKT